MSNRFVVQIPSASSLYFVKDLRDELEHIKQTIKQSINEAKNGSDQSINQSVDLDALPPFSSILNVSDPSFRPLILFESDDDQPTDTSQYRSVGCQMHTSVDQKIELSRQSINQTSHESNNMSNNQSNITSHHHSFHLTSHPSHASRSSNDDQLDAFLHELEEQSKVVGPTLIDSRSPARTFNQSSEPVSAPTTEALVAQSRSLDQSFSLHDIDRIYDVKSRLAKRLEMSQIDHLIKPTRKPFNTEPSSPSDSDSTSLSSHELPNQPMHSNQQSTEHQLLLQVLDRLNCIDRRLDRIEYHMKLK